MRSQARSPQYVRVRLSLTLACCAAVHGAWLSERWWQVVEQLSEGHASLSDGALRRVLAFVAHVALCQVDWPWPGDAASRPASDPLLRALSVAGAASLPWASRGVVAADGLAGIVQLLALALLGRGERGAGLLALLALAWCSGPWPVATAALAAGCAHALSSLFSSSSAAQGEGARHTHGWAWLGAAGCLAVAEGGALGWRAEYLTGATLGAWALERGALLADARGGLPALQATLRDAWDRRAAKSLDAALQVAESLSAGLRKRPDGAAWMGAAVLALSAAVTLGRGAAMRGDPLARALAAMQAAEAPALALIKGLEEPGGGRSGSGASSSATDVASRAYFAAKLAELDEAGCAPLLTTASRNSSFCLLRGTLLLAAGQALPALACLGCALPASFALPGAPQHTMDCLLAAPPQLTGPAGTSMPGESTALQLQLQRQRQRQQHQHQHQHQHQYQSRAQLLTTLEEARARSEASSLDSLAALQAATAGQAQIATWAERATGTCREVIRHAALRTSETTLTRLAVQALSDAGMHALTWWCENLNATQLAQRAASLFDEALPEWRDAPLPAAAADADAISAGAINANATIADATIADATNASGVTDAREHNTTVTTDVAAAVDVTVSAGLDAALRKTAKGFVLDDALAALEAATQLDPLHQQSWYRLGATLAAQGKDAQDTLAIAVRLDPTDYKARHAMASLLISKGQPRKALAHLYQALLALSSSEEQQQQQQQQQERQRAANKAGWCMRVREDLCHAMLAAGEADTQVLECTTPELSLAGGQRACFFEHAATPGLYNTRGLVLARMQKTSEAKQELGTALALSVKLRDARDPAYSPAQHADALNNLGAIFFDESELQRALEAFEAALRAMPQHQRAKSNLEMLLEDSSPPPLF